MSSRYNLRNHKELRRAFNVLAADDFGGEISDADFEIESDIKSEADSLSCSSADEVKTEVDEDPLGNVPEGGNSPKRSRMESVHGQRRFILREKNSFRCSSRMPETRETRLQGNNPVVLHLPGSIAAARECKSPLEAWRLMFDDAMIDKIVTHTNDEIERQLSGIEAPQTIRRHTCMEELNAFIGLLYLSGVQKTNNTNIEELWSVEYGQSLFRCAMPEKRFQFLSVALRFDDKDTRKERKRSDKFAPIREIWELLIENCKKHYAPHEYCTIEEQLLGFRGRCSFRARVKSNPEKYGLKIVMMNDAKTFYMINAMPHVGKVQTEHGESVLSYFVRNLSTAIHGTSRNITFDNCYASSAKLACKMLIEHDANIVETICNNERHVPSEMPRSDKSEHAKSTKRATGSFDQFCREYTTARKTLRWPMRVFFCMLDQAGINGMVLYCSNSKNELKNRRTFLKELSLALVKPWLRLRLLLPTLRRILRANIMALLKQDEMPRIEHRRSEKQARCGFCKARDDRKTKKVCTSCSKHMCEEHRSPLCAYCDV